MKVDWYECKNQACLDNGGTCLLAVPAGVTEPTACTTPDECTPEDCKWVKVSQETVKEWFSDGDAR